MSDRRLRRLHAELRLLRVLPALAVALFTIAIVLSIAALSQIQQVKTNTAKSDSTARRLDRVVLTLYDDAIQQCERVNVLRMGVNENSGIIYRVLFNAARSNSTAARAYAGLIREVDYRPPTNCLHAVARGKLYTPPRLIPIYKLDRAGLFDRRTGEVK